MATATLNHTPGVHGLASNVSHDVRDMMQSGNYYVTPELANKLGNINCGVESIKLDQQLMASSKDWAARFAPQEHNGGTSQALGQAASTLFDLKQGLTSRRIKSLQDNEARETHHVAMDKLNRVENVMNPYVSSSVDHIKQFCDHVGVTERYTGYRHNLNRGNRDPVRLGYSWLDNQKKNALNGTLNVGWRQAPSSAVAPRNSLPQLETRRASAPPMHDRDTTLLAERASEKPARSIQEQCGINMTFPGRTEYMHRYVRPHPPKRYYPDFKINPSPDFTIYGRPNARAEFIRNSTEYQTRYEWPDSAKMDKQPWIRK